MPENVEVGQRVWWRQWGKEHPAVVVKAGNPYAVRVDLGMGEDGRPVLRSARTKDLRPRE